MALVLVHNGNISGGRISKLRVSLHGLGERELDRDGVLSWMKDGHSFVPLVRGKRLPALQLVKVGEDEEPFVRTDNEATAEDSLPF